MALLAIKGHKTRGSEVIALLKMLGGTNRENCCGVFENRLYLINAFNDIEDISLRDNSKYHIYTLEQFEEKFPYKVGDNVKCWINGYCSINTIKNIQWDSIVNEVKYKIGDYWYSAINLQPHKEETMEENIKEKCDLINFNSHQTFDFADKVELALEDDWEVKNEDGRTFVVRKQPQYPKTYEECRKVLFHNFIELGKILTNGYNCDLLKKLGELLICRDAYWKLYGDWKPDWTSKSQSKFVIAIVNNKIEFNEYYFEQKILAFPTAEIRDLFYKNFKDLIEFVKKLL